MTAMQQQGNVFKLKIHSCRDFYKNTYGIEQAAIPVQLQEEAALSTTQRVNLLNESFTYPFSLVLDQGW
jgi:hypothetical protein